MSFTIIVDPNVDATFRKMWQKDSARFGQIEKKLKKKVHYFPPVISPS